jgi:hypothetical protein
MRTPGLFRGGLFSRRLCRLLLVWCIFCFPVTYVLAHGGGSGGSGSSSGSSGSGSGSSGSSGSGSSGGHGGPGGSMGGSSAGAGSVGSVPGNGSMGGGGGHGSTSGGSGRGGAGHASAASSAHGTSVSHNATMAVAKNSATRNQVMRHDFTSDTMLLRSPDRIRNRLISSGTTSTGESTQETERRKKLKAKQRFSQ